ncbi:MAG: OmpH family outer membrane protein [Desulfobacterales bacterium]
MRIVQRILVVALFTVFCFAVSANAAEVNRIGVLDFQRIIETSEAGKLAQTKIKSKGETMQAALMERNKEIEELRKRLEREALVMDQAMREEKQRDYRIKVNDLKALEKKYQEDMRSLQSRIVGRLRKEVFRLAEKMGKEGGYTVILDKGTIIYSTDAIDITDQIIPLIKEETVRID